MQEETENIKQVVFCSTEFKINIIKSQADINIEV